MQFIVYSDYITRNFMDVAISLPHYLSIFDINKTPINLSQTLVALACAACCCMLFCLYKCKLESFRSRNTSFCCFRAAISVLHGQPNEPDHSTVSVFTFYYYYYYFVFYLVFWGALHKPTERPILMLQLKGGATI